jgi:hypothetical protein
MKQPQKSTGLFHLFTRAHNKLSRAHSVVLVIGLLEPAATGSSVRCWSSAGGVAPRCLNCACALDDAPSAATRKHPRVRISGHGICHFINSLSLSIGNQWRAPMMNSLVLSFFRLEFLLHKKSFCTLLVHRHARISAHAQSTFGSIRGTVLDVSGHRWAI